MNEQNLYRYPLLPQDFLSDPPQRTGALTWAEMMALLQRYHLVQQRFRNALNGGMVDGAGRWIESRRN